MLFCISFYLGKSKVVFLPEGLIGYVKPESKVSCLKTIWGTAWVGFVCGRQKKVVRASKQDFHHGLCNTTKHQGLDSMQWQFIETTRSDEEWIWRESCPPTDKWQSLIMVCWPAHNSKTTTRGRSKESKFFKSFIITLCQRRSWPYCTTCLPTFCPFVWASQGIGKHHKYVPVCAVLIVKLQKDIGPYAKLNLQHTHPKPWRWQIFGGYIGSAHQAIRERIWNKFAEFHLVLHFEECSPCFTLNCESIFLGELHGTFPIWTVAGLQLSYRPDSQ